VVLVSSIFWPHRKSSFAVVWEDVVVIRRARVSERASAGARLIDEDSIALMAGF